MIERYRMLKEENRDKSDEYNPIFMFQGVSTELLVSIATEKLNAKELAEMELMNRGRDENGKWIGFNNAEEYWNKYE